MSPSVDVTWDAGNLSRKERYSALRQRGATVWFTGLPGSGKSTLAGATEATLVRAGRLAYRLDGDNLRHGLTSDLGFSRADRDENVRRVAEVARLFADAGGVSLVSLVSPYEAARQIARRLHQEADVPFFEVWVNTSLSECLRRDPKGLYGRARQGEVANMTGLDSPYEPPSQAELTLPMDHTSITEAVEKVVGLLPSVET